MGILRQCSSVEKYQLSDLSRAPNTKILHITFFNLVISLAFTVKTFRELLI